MPIRQITLFALVLLLCSCRATKTIQTAIVKKDSVVVAKDVTMEQARLDSISFIQEQYRQLVSNRIRCGSFSGKMDIDYVDGDGKKTNANGQIRILSDSIVWASITFPDYLGVEGVRALITRDSVRLINKRDKVYLVRSIAYLRELTGLPLDLSSLQDLFLGNPLFFDSTLSAYSQAPGSILLSGTNAFFTVLFTIGETDKLLQSAKFDDLDQVRNRNSFLQYNEYENKAGFPFSLRRNIAVSEKKKLNVEIRYKQYTFNETLSFPFSVPKNYRRD